jgi:hypothetical protein
MSQLLWTKVQIVFAAFLLALLAGCSDGGGSAGAGGDGCATLAGHAAGFLPPGTVITSATFTAATSTVPEHCNVIGTTNANRLGAVTSGSAAPSVYTYAINWQVRLPTAWNGKFYMPGGGGTDGSIPSTTTNLNLGYAVAANDSGHNNAINSDPLAGGAASFGTDYPARVDFAYNAIDKTTQTAKALINVYYGSQPRYSYFQGCSMGGREAMMVSQRFPTYFDGVVAGDPAFRITKVGAWAVYSGQQFANLARSTGLISANNVPFANNTYTDQDLQLVSNAILSACDSLDGLVDGMVNNSQACTTALVSAKLNTVSCGAGPKTAACLSPLQITTILNVNGSGAPNSGGAQQYAPWMWDPGIAGCTSAATFDAGGSIPRACTPAGTSSGINAGYRAWQPGPFNAAFVPNVSTTANGALSFASLGGGAVPLLFATPPILPAPTANDGLANLIFNLNYDSFAQSIFGTSAQFPLSDTTLLNVDSTDLSGFKARSGKLLLYVGQTGGPFSPQDLVNYYTDLNTASGGTAGNFAPAQSFARLFLVPGMDHCGGGPATSTFDPFAAVVNWVENGVAPATIPASAPATGTPFPNRTRNLCPYPQYPRYNGGGANIELASSFTCQ